MLFGQTYGDLLEQQSGELERKTRRIGMLLQPDLSFAKLFFARNAAKKLHLFLLNQSLNAKGLLAVVEKNSTELSDKNHTDSIRRFEQIIKLNIKLKGVVARITGALESQIPEYSSWEPILEETIENLYSVLRILKRHHRLTPHETSDLARESANTSLNSLETIIHGRRAT
jgi:hypothetical protein